MTITLPKWSGELSRYLSIRPQYIFDGNVYDLYPVEISGGITTLRLVDYIRAVLVSEGYESIVKYEPFTGFSVLHGDNDAVNGIIGEGASSEKIRNGALGRAADSISRIVYNRSSYSAVILNYASRYKDLAGDEIDAFYYQMFRLCRSAEPRLLPGREIPLYNIIIWIFDKEQDIPSWYCVDNPGVQVITVPKPDYSVRKILLESLSRNFAGYSELPVEQKNRYLEILIRQTRDLHADEIISIISLAKREKKKFPDIGEIIQIYRLGIPEDRWNMVDRSRIQHAESILASRLKGQIQAIKKASDILKRSYLNLSLHDQGSLFPKGIMFITGPAGSGKTTMASLISEEIFGSGIGYVRYNMSDFREEKSLTRITGHCGRDITDRSLIDVVREEPFSVILFDEIEKAHPKVIDQIIRMIRTGVIRSERGDIAYLSGCFLIFTCNMKMNESGENSDRIEYIDASMDYSTMEISIRAVVDHYFSETLSRPEMMSCIGSAIVVCDFIRHDASVEIFESMLDTLIGMMQDRYGISIRFRPSAKEQLAGICCCSLMDGARGIVRKLEEAFLHPLSRSLFEMKAGAGEMITITGITESDGGWELSTDSHEQVK